MELVVSEDGVVIFVHEVVVVTIGDILGKKSELAAKENNGKGSDSKGEGAEKSDNDEKLGEFKPEVEVNVIGLLSVMLKLRLIFKRFKLIMVVSMLMIGNY